RLSAAIPPGRSGSGRSPSRDTTVDSTPTGQGPPSRIISIRPPSSSITWSALVGLTLPDRLALGAATGLPTAARRSRAERSAGTRTARLDMPAEHKSDARQAALLGRTRV